MGQPHLPIEVDDDTGVWTTDGLPMLYVPRHFFTNNHIAVEAALGREKYSEILYPAGYKSAHFWCEKEAATHQLGGLDVFEHYLKRLSQRGWGLFSFISADAATGHAEIALRNSSFVLQQPGVSGKLCYMFEGWFAGAMDWVGKDAGHSYTTVSRETHCASEAHPSVDAAPPHPHSLPTEGREAQVDGTVSQSSPSPLWGLEATRKDKSLQCSDLSEQGPGGWIKGGGESHAPGSEPHCIFTITPKAA